jgi:SseB protein N-terminal domain
VDLTAGGERFRDDHGAADPAVDSALAAYAAGTGGEHAVLLALAESRLLVPVVAVRTDEPPGREGDGGARPSEREQAGGAEKASEMAMPVIVGADGRRALPAFTCLDTVRRWQPAARPVPVAAPGVWQSAVQESCAVVIDIAGPVPIAVEGARLAALAAGQVPGMYEDPDVWQQVAAAAAEVAPGIRVRLSQPAGGLDFTLELAPPQGSPGLVPEDVASKVAAAVHARLAGRARAGFAVMRRRG